MYLCCEFCWAIQFRSGFLVFLSCNVCKFCHLFAKQISQLESAKTRITSLIYDFYEGQDASILRFSQLSTGSVEISFSQAISVFNKQPV